MAKATRRCREAKTAFYPAPRANRVLHLCRFVLLALCISSSGECDQPGRDQLVSEYRRETTNLQLGKDGTVELIRLSKPTVKNETLQRLPQFPQLRYLAVVSDQVTDDGLAPIAELNKLDTLFISEAAVSGEGLLSIRELTELERLSLTSLPLSKIPVGVFDNLRKVVSLSLAKTRVGDADVDELLKLGSLESLTLDHTNITDDGVRRLRSLGKLKFLSLTHTSVTGAGLDGFAEHQALRHLVLSNSPISDVGLKAVSKTQSLEMLELFNTDISRGATDSLRSELPDSKIFVHFDDDEHEAAAVDVGRLAASQGRIVEEGEVRESIVERFRTNDGSEFKPDFQRHVIPLLGRLGCNSRNCHGSFQGRRGFQLSMFGYDFQLDHDNLSERIDLEHPAESLIVNKPTSDDEHEGGKRFEVGSWQQKLLERWISTGAAARPEDAADFSRLDVTPTAIDFDSAGQERQLQVVAVWSDGSREDVTALARFESKDDAIARVDASGSVTAVGSGDTHIIVYYDNGIQPVQVIMPLHDPASAKMDETSTPTRIDEFVVAKLQKLGIQPSPLATDETFLRRVSLDMIGTLPTPQEVREFIADSSNDKRSRKIDELLEHDAYVAWWTNRLCDLTGANAGYLGNTEMARPVSLQWQAWIERRVRDNTGWDKIARGLITSTSRRPGQSYHDFAAQQSKYTRLSNPDDFAAPGNPMPHYWFRDNIRIPSDKALSFGYIFMGLRLDCA